MRANWQQLFLVPCLLVSACAFTDVPVTLAEFEPALPAGHAPALTGRTVRITEITFDGDVARGWSESEPGAEPDGFQFHRMGSEASGQWSAAGKARRALPEEKGPVIGSVRNGFGMKTAAVYALGDPASWLRAMLCLELEHQGVRMVSDGAADIELRAQIRHLEVDLYMTTKAHLVVDFTITSDGGARELRLHTYGTKVAWWGSSSEYYAAIRSAAQQLLWRLLLDPVLLDPEATAVGLGAPPGIGPWPLWYELAA